MNDDDPVKFKIRMDDESPDAMQMDELKTQKIDKLNQRVTILTILLPCLMILMTVFGYIEIKKRLTNNMDASTTAVSDLYKEIDGQLSNLTMAVQGMDNKLTADISNLDKTAKDIENLKSYFTEIKSSTVGKKDQEKALSRINQQITPIQKLVDGLRADIKVLNDETTKKIDVSTQKIDEIMAQIDNQDKSFKTLQAKLSSLDKSKIGFKKFRDTLKNETDELNAKNIQLKKELNSLRIELLKTQNQMISGTPGNGNSTKVIEQTIE